MNIPALFSATLVLAMVAAPASATIIYESNAQGRLLAIDNLPVNGVYYRVTFPWFPPPFYPVGIVGENYTAPIGDGSDEAIDAAMRALANALNEGGGPWVKGDWCSGENPNEHYCYVPYVDSILATNYQGYPLPNVSRLGCDEYAPPSFGRPGEWGFCDIYPVGDYQPVYGEVPAVWSIVPEPSAISLTFIGISVFLWSRKTRKAQFVGVAPR